MQVGWVKTGEFQQITGYIAKTVKDRRMVSIKVEYEVVRALSNGDITCRCHGQLGPPRPVSMVTLLAR